MAVPPVLAISALVLIALALVIVGFALGKRSSRTVRSVLVGVGALTLAGAGYITYDAYTPETRTNAVVAGTMSEEAFTLPVKHEWLYATGSSYHFTANLTWAEMLSALQERYPDGTPIGEESWELVSPTIPALVTVSDRSSNEYAIVSQTATLMLDEDSNSTVFAYPAGLEKNVRFESGTATEGPTDIAGLRSYYEHVDGAVVTEQDITVPASAGFVRLDFVNGKVMATHVNQQAS